MQSLVVYELGGNRVDKGVYHYNEELGGRRWVR